MSFFGTYRIMLSQCSNTWLFSMIHTFWTVPECFLQFQSFRSSLSLLEDANGHAAKLPGRETGRLCKLLIWMLLMTKIQHCLHELPCVDSEYILLLLVLFINKSSLITNYCSFQVIQEWRQVERCFKTSCISVCL